MRICRSCCGTATQAFSGVIHGCGSLGLDATVDFQVGGVSQGIVTSNATTGAYSGAIAAGTYDLVVTPISARLVASTFSGVVILAGTNVIATKTANTPATGYHCSALAALPLADTFDMGDTLFAGNHPMTWGSGGGGGWSSAFYGSGIATLVASNGQFSYSSLTGSLSSITMSGGVFTIVWTRSTRTWTATNA